MYREGVKWTDADKDRLRAACEEWRGTPHVHRRMIKGKGVDCVHFVAAVLVEAEIVEPIEHLPSYPTAWGLMSPENVLGIGLAKILNVRRVPWDEAGGLQFGDIVIFKAGRQSNHAGIFLDGRIWHVMNGGHVHPALPVRFATGIQEVVRLLGKGWKADPNSVNVHRLLDPKS